MLADDLDYTPADLDRSVVVPDQIRTILRTYRDVVQTELFPGRTLVPKNNYSPGPVAKDLRRKTFKMGTIPFMAETA